MHTLLARFLKLVRFQFIYSIYLVSQKDTLISSRRRRGLWRYRLSLHTLYQDGILLQAEPTHSR